MSRQAKSQEESMSRQAKSQEESMLRSRFALVMLLALSACAGALPMVTESDARRTGTPLDLLAAGRTRYIDKCSGCHVPFAPDHLTAAAWPAEVAEMSERARLAPADREIIVAYLAAFAAEAQVASPLP
jgi:diheme cytochrome c